METGILYIVATPIGNLGDITLRAIEVLGMVDLILAEDTRISARLLRRYEITTPVMAFHEHNEREMASRMVARLEQGANIALISDAGTPLLSDPGFHLVRLLRAQGKRVIPIPGPSAVVCALSAGGLPMDRFVFEGFLPSKREARRRRLQALAEETRTLVLYEAPHRILDAIRDITELFGGERQGVIARELTKTFETIHAGPIENLHDWLRKDENNRRGEFVLMIGGKPEEDNEGIGAEELRTLHLVLEELPIKKAVALTARLTGRKRNALYRLALQIMEKSRTIG
uniref:Ribosomal RNA small subunit methyltransferase I n=1 Tax=Candidatus Kentrum sp. MB TaxID=2138164 RepID=A0A450XNI7_9GAMM|nr:MAG: 16S rRNA (cytidine1402-2'-O)-methyltransferase [Candidatus Kentron sp. MB]VFK30836.1 MAG: 16S rRNA (cytidine1402-2'-O)-methyltransferase [Candidatus Kentron sp. MB]VFK75258.1 MAG: 16S rRNA (cytidine1402-2'-O)-methyltransferase [Candidatus Kentron sp. MB]